MIEQVVAVWSTSLYRITLDIIGLFVILFCAIWIVIGAFRVLRHRNARDMGFGVLLAGVSLAGVALFVYLSASTTARRAFIDIPMRELAGAFATSAVAFTLAVIAVVLISLLVARLSKGSEIRAGVATISILAVIILGTSGILYATTHQPDIDQVWVDPVSVTAIKVEDDLPISTFEDKITDAPTAMTLGPDNELYVAGIKGQIWIMKDEDDDGQADRVTEFASGLKQPEGLAWSPDGLFVTEIDKLVLLQDANGDGKADEKKIIVDGFPGEIYKFHQSNGLTFGPDGRLYIGVGSTTDHSEEPHPLAARLLSVNPDGTDLRVVATGLRNPFGLIPAPGGGFFASENGSSGCVDTPAGEDCKNKVDVPEEINYIVPGRDYGFPNYYGIPPQESGTEPPVVTFPDHSSPSGIAIYDGDALPEKYRGRMFVSLWARNELHTIRLIKLPGDRWVGDTHLFASGIPGPSAIINSPSGGIYVASYSSNVIYEIGGKHSQALASAGGKPAAPKSATNQPVSGDVARGIRLFTNTCAACHGPDGKGVQGVGQNLVESEFVAAKTDQELIEFIRQGRDAHDPQNTMGITMPAKGGNASLSDEALADIVTYLRSINKPGQQQ